MLRQLVKIFLSIVILSFMLAGNPAARTNLVCVGNDIPRQLPIGARFIFINSDSLFLNGRLLERDVHYKFVSGYGYFDLAGIKPEATDSLVVIYRALPVWLEKSYGRPLVSPASGTVNTAFVPTGSSMPYDPRSGSEINISGAKTFRFSARTAGNSEFNQSLDLKIAGELKPGLEITGSISDRGYDPVYGTANSRLNEIDKINIRLKSSRLTAQVGDINVNPLMMPGGSRSVSGASFMLGYPHWYVHGTVARPKGLFESFSFYGRDGYQGPYQVGTGNSATAIVPGSETVWLDGIPLERGANKDYTMDYVTGRITFNVTRFIDNRSRIEIDYEPLATRYKGELFAVGTGAHTPDSALFFSVDILREGDDRRQPLAGELSSSDRALLEAAGDEPAYRYGVTADSAGNYSLVTDSLPDTVFNFVGDGKGDYNITFSYVGPSAGDYKFLGNGRYEYVGDSRGDYQPVIILVAPVRTDYMQALVGTRNNFIGEFKADIRRSVYDRNLLSSLDDKDNEAWYYSLQSQKNWNWNERRNELYFRRRVVENNYKTLSRINLADFNRDFMLPDDFKPETNQTLHEMKSTVSPLRFTELTGFFSVLDYTGRFQSRTSSLKASLYPYDRLTLSGAWKRITADYSGTTATGEGRGHNWQSDIRYELSNMYYVNAGYERDNRENSYSAVPQGNRYDRVYGEIAGTRGALRYEYYREDSLNTKWNETLARHRVTSSLNDHRGALSYDLSLAYQWLNRPDVTERNFLGRLNLGYYNLPRKFRVTSSFTISEERRNARGITYLEVEPGQGNYIYEDGQYINDPDGNYILVEEILSDNAKVRSGRKTFHLSKDWQVLIFHFSSDIDEELLEGGRRTFWWCLPFYNDRSQPYLYLMRRYNADIRLLPVSGFHIINIVMVENLEIRDIGGFSRQSRDNEGEVSFKQKWQENYFDEKISLFRYDRDDYYSGAGTVDGYQLSFRATSVINTGEVSTGTGYRRAESELEERSELITVTFGSRLRVISKAELRADLELYRQLFKNISGYPSYKLTGNRPGEKGAEWQVSFNYNVRDGLRMNFTLSGKHADNRPARFTGRGEVVAGF